jgi:hypothetical protein
MIGADVESLRDPDHGTGFMGSVMATIDAFREKPAKLGKLEFDPANYALTVIGTPVWAGRMSPAVRTYLQRFAPQLEQVGVFVTSENTRASKIVLPVERMLGHHVDAFAGFEATDLADRQFYDEKIATFVNTLRRSMTPMPAVTAAAR